MASATKNNELFQQQLTALHRAAAEYWQVEFVDGHKMLDAIQVVKVTGGKMTAILPAQNEYPSAFCKVYFYDRGFQFESAGLEAAHSMPHVDGMRVPAVLRIMPQYNAIITERRYWQDSTTPLKRFFVQSLKVDWARLGSWLRQFHDTTVSFNRNDYFLRKKFEKITAQMQALAGLFTDDQLVKMETIISQAKDYFNTNSIEWVISHGDFGLDNIKFAGGIMDIIDFEDCQPAPRAFDILNFLTRLDYTARFPHNQQTYNRIKSDFLSGYGMEIEQTPVSDFLYLLIKLDMIESYHRRQNHKTSRLINKIIFMSFKMAGESQLKPWLEEKGQ